MDHLVHLFQELAGAVHIVGVLALEYVVQTRLHHGLGIVGLALVGHDGDVALIRGRVGQAHHRGVGQVDAGVIRALLQAGVADLGGQHAHDAELVGTDLQRLAHAVAAEGHAVEVVADDADLLVVFDVHILQAAPLGNGVVLQGGVVFIHTVDVEPAVGVGADLQVAAAAEVDLGRDGLDQLRVLFGDGIDVVHRDGAGAIAPDVDVQGVGSHGGKAVPHALGHAIAQADDDDDRHNADDDAQHGQEGAELVAPDILDGLPEGLDDHACTSCSAVFSGVSGSRVGCTMASGAWESPS